jgi:DNA repair protein RadC
VKTQSPRKSAAVGVRVVADSAAVPLAGAAGRARAKRLPAAPACAGAASELAEHERAVIDAALAILRARLKRPGRFIDSASAAREAFVLRLGHLDCECFAAMFLDWQYRLIAFEELFRGTLGEAAVYPREIARAALRHNAARVIVAHNHPSGVAEPSESDKLLTAQLRLALKVIGVELLDHFVIAGDRATSFLERRLM